MDERLHQLVRQIQQLPSGSSGQQQAIADLVSHILKVRQIARPQPGQSLSPVQQEILGEAHLHLKQEISSTIAQGKAVPGSLEEWAQSLRGQTFQVVLTESRLQQLAIAVQKLQPQSQAWQSAMRELVQALHLSGKLASSGRLSPDLYHEALNEAVIWMYNHIQNYDPARGQFIAWVNFRLNMIGREVAQKQNDPYVQSVQGRLIRTRYQLNALVRRVQPSDLLHWLELTVRRLVSNTTLGYTVTVILSLAILMKQQSGLLDKVAQAAIAGFPQLITTANSEILEAIPQSDGASLSQILRQYISDDPQRILQQRCMRDRPKITLQLILQELFIHERQWKEISSIYEVGIPTLSNFYQRSIKSLAPEIRRAIQDEFEVG